MVAYIIVGLCYIFLCLKCIATGLLYLFFGFNYTLEAQKYITEANYYISHHSFSAGRYLFYSTTILLIAGCKVLGINLAFAIVALLAFNLYCYVKVYKALIYYTQSSLFAVVFCISLVSFSPFQSWTMYLYTENIFYSLLLLLFAHLLSYKSFTAKYISQLTAIVIVILFSRPLGILLLLPLLLFLWLRATKLQRVGLGIASIVGILFFYTVSQVVLTTTNDWTVQRSFIEENLICDIPTNVENKNLDTIAVSSQLKVLAYYITHNFTHFTGLAAQRLYLFFVPIRTYYSTLHNAILLTIILPLYVLLIYGVRLWYRQLHVSMVVFIISSILLFAASVAMQCDDYHNRFFLCLFPFLLFLVLLVLRKMYRSGINYKKRIIKIF